MLSSLFIAKEADVQVDSNPDDFPNVACKPVDTLRFEALAMIVCGRAGELEPLDVSGEQFVIPIDAELVERLAKLDPEAIMTAATKWAKAPAWDPKLPSAQIKGLLAEMCALAEQATREDKRMYLWMSL